MAKMEASFPVDEANDNARKRIPFSARVSIQDVASEHTVVVSIDDLKMVRLLSDEFKVAHRMSFRALQQGYLTRNGQEVARTPITGQRVHFQIPARADELSV